MCIIALKFIQLDVGISLTLETSQVLSHFCKYLVESPLKCLHQVTHNDCGRLKLKLRQYPAIHTNYSVLKCTIFNEKHLNGSSDLVIVN